jgi:hypothetical protein
MAHSATTTASAVSTFSVLDQKKVGEKAEEVDGSASSTAWSTVTNVMGSWFSQPQVETPPIDPEQVRVVSPSEYQAAGESLAEAFLEDCVSRYFLDTPETVSWTEDQKWELHRSIMEYATYAHCVKGLTMTVGENYGAVALW